MITSAQNDKIKEVRALQGRSKVRREANAFVAEGVRLLEEAHAAGWRPQLVLYTEGLDERAQALVDAFRGQGAQVEAVAEHVMQAASDTETPQGVLAVFPLPEHTPPPNVDLILIVDQVRDPGNLGTLLRSAAAAGVSAVFTPPGTADAFSPKVLRAGMGANFQLPILSASYAEIAAACAGLQVFLAAARQGQAYTEVDLRQPLALVIGSEAEGAGAEIAAIPHQAIHIPMPGRFESLNAAVAGSILLFEIVRQRTHP